MEKKLKINFARAISEFESAMKEFKLKRILYKTVFRGRGLEFDKYRDFSPEDDASDIDWKSSLRANKILIKQYIEERDLNFYFVVDVSNSMLFGSADKLKAEYAAEVVAAWTHLVMNSRDNACLIMFTDNMVKIVPPANSKNQFYLINHYLSDLNLYGGNFDFNAIVEFLSRLIKSPYSVIVFVSDFIHFNKTSEKLLKTLGARFETIALMVRDVFDDSIASASSQLILKDPYSDRQILIDPKIAAKQYSAFALEQKNFVKKLFLEADIDLLELKTNKSFVMPLVSFLERRAGRK